MIAQNNGKMSKMAYLIDGHNLIPKVAGLNLGDMDDELGLISLLQTYCRVFRQQVEVYFDGAPVGQAGSRRVGQIPVHFVKLGQTADDAIANRLARLGRAARNWRVVSSDRRVQAEARARGAEVVSSESFAADLAVAQIKSSSQVPNPDQAVSPAEVDHWLELFDKKEKPAD
jgi:predicted RNA-binding protein with PIN domain